MIAKLISMRPAVTVAVIFIEILLTTYSAGDASVSETFDDILEKYGEPGITLPLVDRKFIRKLPLTEWKAAVKHYKEEYKNMFTLKERMIKAEAKNAELELKMPVYHFYCAVMKANGLLQYFTELIGNYPLFYLPTIPALYVDLIDAQTPFDRSFTDIYKFNNRVSRFYYFIQKTDQPFAASIKRSLDLYQKEHVNVFESMDDLYAAFCSSVARSSFLFNYLQHVFLFTIDRTDFRGKENTFIEFLGNTAPFYYLDEIDVTFLNILLISISPEGKINPQKLFTFLEIKFKPKFFTSYPVYDSRVIVLPQSNNCPKIEGGSTGKALPFSTSIPYQ